MPSTNVRKGLYWSDRTRTWHYEFRFRGKKHNGDTGMSSSRTLAEGYVAKLKEQLSAKEIGMVLPSDSPTLQELWEEWEATQKRQVTDKHIEDVRRAVQIHAVDLLQTRVGQIDEIALQRVRNIYLNAPDARRSEGGANNVLKLLHALLNWGVPRYLPRAPRLKPLKPQEDPRAIIWPEQVQAFLSHADDGGWQAMYRRSGHEDYLRDEQDRWPHSATAMRLMIGLGLRENEALTARWEWVDARRQIYIVGRSKSRKLREIPIPLWLMEHLLALWQARKKPKTGMIIPERRDENGVEHPHDAGFTRKPCSRCAGLLKVHGLSPHRLRAVFATTHYEIGTPPGQIQQMLGHKSLVTTMRYIVQRPKDQILAQAKAAEAMGFTDQIEGQQSPTSPQKSDKHKTNKSKTTVKR
nr:site-specific integrase [uncultured Holophaga sp.]